MKKLCFPEVRWSTQGVTQFTPELEPRSPEFEPHLPVLFRVTSPIRIPVHGVRADVCTRARIGVGRVMVQGRLETVQVWWTLRVCVCARACLCVCARALAHTHVTHNLGKEYQGIDRAVSAGPLGIGKWDHEQWRTGVQEFGAWLKSYSTASLCDLEPVISLCHCFQPLVIFFSIVSPLEDWLNWGNSH